MTYYLMPPPSNDMKRFGLQTGRAFVYIFTAKVAVSCRDRSFCFLTLCFVFVHRGLKNQNNMKVSCCSFKLFKVKYMNYTQFHEWDYRIWWKWHVRFKTFLKVSAC